MERAFDVKRDLIAKDKRVSDVLDEIIFARPRRFARLAVSSFVVSVEL